jgi:hypothetical protein
MGWELLFVFEFVEGVREFQAVGGDSVGDRGRA